MNIQSEKKKTSLKPIHGLLLGIIVLFVGVGIAWLFHSFRNGGQVISATETVPSPTLSSIAPAESVQLNVFDGRTLSDFSLESLDGTVVHLSDFTGKAVLINLWATWCTPCQEEMPALQTAYDQYKNQGLVILGINYTIDDNVSDVTAFVNEYALTFPVLLDETGDVYASTFDVAGLPDSFFIDPKGVIREVQIGEISADNLTKYIKEILPPAS